MVTILQINEYRLRFMTEKILMREAMSSNFFGGKSETFDEPH